MKEFTIFKVKEKKSEKSPDYNISMKINDKFVTVGAGWIRQMKNGPEKFISCKLSDGYKELAGFHIERDTPVKENDSSIEDIKPEEIPF